MRYYRDIDYFIYFEEFPHMGVTGLIAANSDGTVNIYINTLHNAERQEKALRHELRHMAKQHVFCDTMTVAEKEQEADHPCDLSCTFADDFSYVDIEDAPAVLSEKAIRKIPLFTWEGFERFVRSIHEEVMEKECSYSSNYDL